MVHELIHTSKLNSKFWFKNQKCNTKIFDDAIVRSIVIFGVEFRELAQGSLKQNTA